jgi:carbon storage regulator
MMRRGSPALGAHSSRTESKEGNLLIITRRAGEKIMLGDDVVIHVMEIVGSSVRIGIDAPREVPVYREEIWTAVKDGVRPDPGRAEPEPA